MNRHKISQLAAVLLLVCGASAALAQGQGPGGEALLRAGEQALAKGDFETAAGNFAKALRSDGLSDEQVAKALYQRGVAYERAGKPAQAIADITSALYIPGLSGEDRAKAYLGRARAYKAVGLDNLASADMSRARRGGAEGTPVAQAEQSGQGSPEQSGGAAFETSVRSAGSPAPGFATRVESRDRDAEPPAAPSGADAPAPEPKQQQVASFDTRSEAADEPIAQFRTTIKPDEKPEPPREARTAPEQTGGSSAPSWDTAANTQQAAATPQPRQEQDSQESGGKVSNFIGNLWSKATGGGESEPAAEPAQPSAPDTPKQEEEPPQWNQVTSAPSASRPEAPRQAAPEPEPSAPGWSAQVSSPGQASQPRQASAPAPQPAGGGASGYRIQLAALRSDAEAQATWKRLKSKHGDLLSGHSPNIVKTELGGLGTFYRVQLGPFADKASSQQLCKRFQQGGLDCFLLAP